MSEYPPVRDTSGYECAGADPAGNEREPECFGQSTGGLTFLHRLLEDSLKKKRVAERVKRAGSGNAHTSKEDESEMHRSTDDDK